MILTFPGTAQDIVPDGLVIERLRKIIASRRARQIVLYDQIDGAKRPPGTLPGCDSDSRAQPNALDENLIHRQPYRNISFSLHPGEFAIDRSPSPKV